MEAREKESKEEEQKKKKWTFISRAYAALVGDHGEQLTRKATVYAYSSANK